MYDFNRTNLPTDYVAKLKENPLLDFMAPVSTQTGVVNESKIISDYLAIKKFCTITLDRNVIVKFSFHKYSNKGQHNYNDFGMSDFIEVLEGLYSNFQINPYLAEIHNLEFGVNITLPFNTTDFLKSIISYKRKEYSKEAYNGRGYLLRFEFDQYDLKIYDKGLQYQLAENKLRFEIKVKKMEFLNAKGIKIICYADLLRSEVINKLSSLLLKTFKDILMCDIVFSRKGFKGIKNDRERQILLCMSNPKSVDILTECVYNKRRRQFRELVLKYGGLSNQLKVYDLISEKLNLITNIDIDLAKRIDTYLLRFKSESVTEITNNSFLIQNLKCSQNNTSIIGLEKYPFKHYCSSFSSDANKNIRNNSYYKIDTIKRKRCNTLYG